MLKNNYFINSGVLKEISVCVCVCVRACVRACVCVCACVRVRAHSKEYEKVVWLK